jgi:colanic acid/amylovoran biosynthesis glycosyltransferase
MKAAIFRHSLYLPSERFIPAQALALKSTNVVMVARDPITHHVPGLLASTISDAGRDAVLRHTLLRDPKPLATLLREHEVEILHAHFGVEGMYSREAAKLLDVPHVTTLHGYDVSLSRRALAAAGKPSWLYYSALRRRHFGSGGTLVCVSEHVRRRALELGAPSEKLEVIGTGVDTRSISFSPLPDEPTVVHVARLVEKKGTSVLIAAFADVIKKVPDAKLRIIGSGPLLSELQAQVEHLELTNNVQFLGTKQHDEVLDEMAQARILCLPSVTAKSGDQEGLGQVLLEAGATGRPVVATRHGGIVDGVVHGETGLLVPERDEKALSAALVDLLNDASASARMGKSGRGLVQRDFDVFVQAKKIEALYGALR